MMKDCRHASQAPFFYSDDPGVPLRSTPGFMLTPATRALKKALHMFRLLIFPARRRLSNLIQHLKKNVELWRIAGNLAHSRKSLFSELALPLLDQKQRHLE